MFDYIIGAALILFVLYTLWDKFATKNYDNVEQLTSDTASKGAKGKDTDIGGEFE